jgi:hypothetical protein
MFRFVVFAVVRPRGLHPLDKPPQPAKQNVKQACGLRLVLPPWLGATRSSSLTISKWRFRSG